MGKTKIKRIVTKIGNVFCVEFEVFKCYFQYVANDLTQLNSSVIRVFEKLYSLDSTPSLDEIVNDKVFFWIHTILRPGIESGLWNKIGTMPVDDINLENIVFGVAQHYKCSSNYEPIEVDPMSNWSIWHLNGEYSNIGFLPKKYHDIVYPGTVYNYMSVYNWIKFGYDKSSNPIYSILKRIPRSGSKIFTKFNKNNSNSYCMFVGENLVKRLDIHEGKVTMIIDGEDPELPKFWATNWNYHDFIEEEEFNEAWNKYVLYM